MTIKLTHYSAAGAPSQAGSVAAYNSAATSKAKDGPPRMTLRDRLRRILLGTIFGAVALLAAAFLADYAVFHIRIAANRSPYGSVTVTHYYAVLQKNGKTEFLFDPPQPQTCVNALFPHQGWSTCWYLKRHPEQRTDI